MGHSGTPFKFMDATFETFERTKGLGEAIAAAQDFAEGRLECLVLSGPTGRGKTHLAVAAARVRAMRDETPRFCFLNVPQFLDRIRASYGGQEDEALIMGPAQDWPVAIIDDLGAQRGTAWADERIYCLIDARYSQGRASVITTNVLPAEWEERVRSRLTDRRGSKVCLITALDYRKGKA